MTHLHRRVQECDFAIHYIVHFYAFDQEWGGGVRPAGADTFSRSRSRFLTLGSEPQPVNYRGTGAVEPPKI